MHDLLARCDGFRKPDRIAQLALVCEGLSGPALGEALRKARIVATREARGG